MNETRLDLLIERHLTGMLTAEERSELEDRLLRSAADRARFWQLAEIHVLLSEHARRKPGTGPVRETGRPFWRATRWPAAAAAVLLLAGAALWWDREESAWVDGAGVLVERAGARLPAAAKPVRLQPGDRVHAGANAPARVVFQPHRAAVTLEPGTVVRVASVRPANLALHRGRLSADVARRPAGNPFSVLTPEALVEVTGTRFTVSSLWEATWVSVGQGTVVVRLLARPTEVNLQPGQFSVAARDLPLVARDIGSRGLAVPLESPLGSSEGDGKWNVDGGIYRQTHVSSKPELPAYSRRRDNPGSFLNRRLEAVGNVRATVRVRLDSPGSAPDGSTLPWGYAVGLNTVQPAISSLDPTAESRLTFKLGVGPAPMNGMDTQPSRGGLQLVGNSFRLGEGLLNEHLVTLDGTAGAAFTCKAGDVCWLKLELVPLTDSRVRLRGKAWHEDELEPDAWMVDAEADAEPIITTSTLFTRRAAGTFDRWTVEYFE